MLAHPSLLKRRKKKNNNITAALNIFLRPSRMRPLLTYVVRCDLMSIPVVLTRYTLFSFLYLNTCSSANRLSNSACNINNGKAVTEILLVH